MTPTSGAEILISPDVGSTRPGATACQRFSSGGVSAFGALRSLFGVRSRYGRSRKKAEGTGQ